MGAPMAICDYGNGGARRPHASAHTTAHAIDAARREPERVQSGEAFVEDLVAQAQALGADPRAARNRHGRDLMPAFPAEAAPVRHGFVADPLQGALGAAVEHGVRARHAFIADAGAWTHDERLDVRLVFPAKRAGLELSGGGAALAPAAASPGVFHDLVHALVTEAEGVRDLAKRPSRELEPAHGPVEIRAGDLGRVLSVDDAGLGGLRLTQQIRIDSHMSTVPRQQTNTTQSQCSQVPWPSVKARAVRPSRASTDGEPS